MLEKLPKHSLKVLVVEKIAEAVTPPVLKFKLRHAITKLKEVAPHKLVLM